MDNVRVITFGADTDPTVNIAAGVDSSTHQIDVNGDSLTVNIGDGATVGQINANSVTDPAGFTLTAGNNVGVIGSVDGSVVAGAQSNYTIGSNFSTTGNLVGSAAGDTTMTIGDGLDVGGRMTASGTGDSVLTVGSNASIGNSLDLRGSGDRTATFGDNASITGNVDVRSTGLNKSVTFGNNANITADVNFLTGGTNETAFFKAGDDMSVAGNFVTSDGADNVIIGNNWFIGGNMDVRLGDDQVRLGYQGTNDPSIISGSVGTGDGLTIAVPPDLAGATLFTANAVAAGWVNNGDGTISAAPGAGNFVYNNHTYTAWETAGDPI